MRNLIVELLKYVKTTGKPINLVPADLPAELKIGWMDKNSGEHWAIGINRAKKWVDSLDEEKKRGG